MDEERLAKHDQNMIVKLAEMDRQHTIKKNLDITEIKRTMETLEEFSTGKMVTTCPADKKKVLLTIGFHYYITVFSMIFLEN